MGDFFRLLNWKLVYQVLPKFFMLVYVHFLSKDQLIVSPTLSGSTWTNFPLRSAWSFLWARPFVFPWACSLMVSWASDFSPVHTVVFQFPDYEEVLLAMPNLELVSLIKRNPDSLNLTSIAEAVLSRSLKEHVVDGNAVACGPVKPLRRKIVGVLA